MMGGMNEMVMIAKDRERAKEDGAAVRRNESPWEGVLSVGLSSFEPAKWTVRKVPEWTQSGLECLVETPRAD